MRPLPRLYLGTMTFGWSQSSSVVDDEIAGAMMKRFIERHKSIYGSDSVVHVDTARIYAGGKTERILGTCLSSLQSDVSSPLVIGTKAHPSQPGGLSPDGIKHQWEASLDAMKLTSTSQNSLIDEYYLHQPDTNHSLLDSLKYAHQLKMENKIQKIGLSNYHASEVQRAFDLCKIHGLTKPTVYQGLYNPLNRMVEEELLPILRENGCGFVAYNPLAAGLLTGKHKRQTPTTQQSEEKVLKGRFKDNPNYLPRFYTERNFHALESIRDACDANGISMVEATLRWLMCHSALTEKDGILIGASSMMQLNQNLDACHRAAKEAAGEESSLPQDVVHALDGAWEKTRLGAFPYWRSYSEDMPGREAMDQGASYSASGKKK